MGSTISTEMLIAIISGIVIPIGAGFIGMFLKMNGITGEVKNLQSTMDLKFEAVGKQVGNVQELMLQRVQNAEKAIEDLRKDKHDDREQTLKMMETFVEELRLQDSAARERASKFEEKAMNHIEKENDKLWTAFKDYKEWSQKNFTNVSVCQAVHPHIVQPQRS